MTIRTARWAKLNTCEYTCECGETVHLTIDAEKAAELHFAGARRAAIERPSELDEVHEGELIDYDDMIEFHQLLERQDWFDVLCRLTTFQVVQPEDKLRRQLYAELISRADYVDGLPPEGRDRSDFEIALIARLNRAADSIHPQRGEGDDGWGEIRTFSLVGW